MRPRALEGVLLVAGVAALFASWSFARGRAPVAQGERVSALAVPVVANGSGSLRVGGPTRGPTVLEFFASWCATCASSLPRTERAVHGARWIAVSVDDSASDAAGAARSWQLRSTVVFDSNRRLHDAYHINAVPTVVVLRADGSVAFSAVGVVSEGEINRQVEEARSTSSRE